MTDPFAEVWPSTVEGSRDRLRQIVKSKVNEWPEDKRMEWEELAGTIEDGRKLARHTAEFIAYFRLRPARGA